MARVGAFGVRMKEQTASRALALGFLVAVLVAVGLLLTARPAHATEFTVTRTSDEPDGSPGNGQCDPLTRGDLGPPPQQPPCTLRAAIQEANAAAGADTIRFNIPGDGPHTISPASELPGIYDPVVIDGYTQPGASKNTSARGTNAVLKVELNGENAGSSRGLGILAPKSVVRGLAVNRFYWDGIAVYDKGAKIEGNFVGTDPSGDQDLGNVLGINDSGSDSIVGGTTPAARNLVSGNYRGIYIQGSGNKVQGNLVGTKKDGTSALGNDYAGVDIQGDSNTVGGAEPGAANTIAFSNQRDGVNLGWNPLTHEPSSGNRLLRNSIFSNAELGIDFYYDGRTANDPDDADYPQNYPQIDSAKLIKKRVKGKKRSFTAIAGMLNSTPGRTFTVEFFSNPAEYPDEGRTFIGQASVTTDFNGYAALGLRVPRAIAPVGSAITATATNADGSTSEFSDPLTVG